MTVGTLGGLPPDRNPLPSRVLVVPNPRSIARHALPAMIEGKVIPVVLFVGFLRFAGAATAVLVALAWSLASIARRLVLRRRVSGVVVLSAVGLAARTVVMLATGQLLVYFLQPLIGTVLVAIAFLVSLALGRPLAERLVHDLCPVDAETAAHPHVRRFFTRLSLFWAITSTVNATITLWLLLTQSATTFVVVKSVLGPASAVIAIGAALVWLRTTTRQQGLSLVMAARTTR